MPEGEHQHTGAKEQLEALPGIGPAKGQAIIGGAPCTKPEDIMKVRGSSRGDLTRSKIL